MDEKVQELQRKLTEDGIPEFVSYIPVELVDKKLYEYFRSLNKLTISEITKDNELLPFIADFSNIPEEQDLGMISKLLSSYPAITGDFFESESTRNKSIKEEYNPNGFNTPAYNKPSSSTTNKPKENKDGKECNVEEYILERISKEILETNLDVKWEDIVGLEDVKKAINEIVLWPMMRPDIFTCLRGPPKGVLLFGPPGTGKTMIGKCIASQCKATFFSISASSLTSKWVGEGEKMVSALFYLARKMSPSVIFIDEIDSLLSQRSDNENEGSRRIKTEFLVQFDGAGVDDKDRILIIGATNRPQEIDEAARRRLVKRIYVALPETGSRRQMIKHLMNSYFHCLNDLDLDEIALLTDGYSGSDIFNLCREASMEPVNAISKLLQN